ncbi:hypothetical protein JTB14_015450 [Gonioctena quinquepunctata]|nr:hypothetical protein JTB14_015450 [Gonioctena quinquepunctata]
MDNKSDPRVNDWLLMSSPFYTLGICLAYVYIVKVLGPKLMENRKPFELKSLLIVYNLFQVIFSTWLFYEHEKGVTNTATRAPNSMQKHKDPAVDVHVNSETDHHLWDSGLGQQN